MLSKISSSVVSFAKSAAKSQTSSTSKNAKPIAIAVPLPLLDGVNELVKNVTDYLVVAEQEATKRESIKASRDVALASIQAQRATMSELIKHTFAERGQVIQKQFEALDAALETGNLGLADLALKGMVTVIQSSPFKSIQEMQQAMGAKDFVIRLE